MSSCLRVVIGDDEDLVRRGIHRCLVGLGHEVVGEACSGEELVEQVVRHRPDLVITDIGLDGMDGLQAIETFSKQHHAAVVLISGYDDEPTLERASKLPVQGYLTKPVKKANLAAATSVAVRRFTETESLQEEVATARRRLADRASVERAKGILMKRGAVDEEAAYYRIREMARQTGQTLGQIAQSIIVAERAVSELLPKPQGAYP